MRDPAGYQRTTMVDAPAIWLVTGVMAAGKSTVAAGIARRFSPAAHVPGDAFREMVVSGRADMTPDPSHEAIGQLRLRYDQAFAAAGAFVDEAGVQHGYVRTPAGHHGDDEDED